MSIVRIQHTTQYVVLNKGALENPKLSFKAKGLWAYCMSRPNDWEFNISHLKTVSQDGEDAIYSAFKELIEHGYCERVQLVKPKDSKTGKWGFQKMDYIIYEHPIQKKNTKPENPDTDFQPTENPALLSNDVKEVMKEKESVCKQPLEKAAIKENILGIVKKKHADGNDIEVSLGDIFHKAIREKKNWTTQEIEAAWKILVQYEGCIRDPFRFIEGTIHNIKNVKIGKAISKKIGDTACKTTSKPTISKENLSANDMEERISLASILDRMMGNESENGSKA